MCSSQSEADITSPLPRVRARRTASKIDFIDGPVDTDEENENIEKLVEAEGDTDFLPPKVVKKKGRPRKTAGKSRIKTNDAGTEMNNKDDTDAQESPAMNNLNTTKHSSSSESNTSIPSKIVKVARANQEPLLGGCSALDGPGQDQPNLQRRSTTPENEGTGSFIMALGNYQQRDTQSYSAVKRPLPATGNTPNVQIKISPKVITDTDDDKNSTVDTSDQRPQSHSKVITSKNDTTTESASSVRVRRKVRKLDYLPDWEDDTAEENEYIDASIENFVLNSKKRGHVGKFAQNVDISKVDGEIEMNDYACGGKSLLSV